MEKDINDRVAKDFGAEAEKAAALLNEFEQKSQASPRLIRCIVHLASGNMDKLKKTIKEAESDWRDVIVSAESADFEFNKPFKSQ